MTQPAATPLPGAMPARLPEGARAPADFDPKALAKSLLRATRIVLTEKIKRETQEMLAFGLHAELLALDSNGMHKLWDSVWGDRLYHWLRGAATGDDSGRDPCVIRDR